MFNVKLKRAITSFAVMLAFLLTALGGGLTVANAATAEDDVFILYANNRNAVKVLDEVVDGEPKYFKQLKDTDAITAEEKVAVMNRIISAANGYTALVSKKDEIQKSGESTLAKEGSLKDEYEQLCSNLTTLYNDSLKLTEANYTTYDVDNTFVTGINNMMKEFTVTGEKVNLGNELWALMAVNEANPDKSAKTCYGFYDTDLSVMDYGVFKLYSIYNAGLTAIAVSEDPVQTRKDYVEQLNAVPRNVFEDIYNDYLAATAVERSDLTPEEADLENNDLVNHMGECQTKVEDFWAGASEDVKKAYATKYDYLQKYFASHQEYDGTAVSKNSSVITYVVDNKTIMTIRAYVKQGYTAGSKDNKAATVFAPNASISLNTATLSGEERNVAKLISDKNNKLDIGYLVRFNVYGGTTKSQLFDTERANKATEGGVIYVIEFNLNNYYEKLLAEERGLIGGLLKGTFLEGAWLANNKVDRIKSASELIAGSETDLCYMYSGGELKPFENIKYEPNGGILMLETTMFGNFAVAAANDSKFWTEPLFWILVVVGIILLLVVIALIRKYKKYSVKFYSNGGTKVKKVRARKGQYFTMPENPMRSGFVFAGWYEDKTLKNRFVATRIIKRKSLKAYAKWALELSPDRVDRYYTYLRNTLASHGALPSDFEIEEGKTKTFAVIEKGEKEIKLYFALDTQELKKAGYNVTAAPAGYEETPSCYVITLRDHFVVAQKLVKNLLETYNLGETEYEEAKEDEKAFALALSAHVAEAPAAEPVEAPVEEPVEETTDEIEVIIETEGDKRSEVQVIFRDSAPQKEEAEAVVETEEPAEEPAEEVVEEPVEEAVEETEVEAPIEEPAEEEPVTDEQLIEYFKKIRNSVCGYALYEKNDKAEDGKMLIKLYKKEEAVYCYMALDPDAYGLETANLGFGDTPALLKIANDTDLEKALSLVEVIMLDHGFEKSDEPVEEKPYEGKGFGYRIHYVEE